MIEEQKCTIPGFYTQTVKKNIPLSTIFELTHRCNLKCRHCYIADREQQELSYGEITGILDQLAEAGTLFLTFTGGEIMMRKDFFDIAYYAKRKGFALKIFSNGTLIDKYAATEIAALKPISIGISIYGADAETHDYYTQKLGSFNRSIYTLRLLHELGITTVVKYLIMKKNAGQIVAMKRLSVEIGAIPNFDPVVSPKNNGDRSPLEHQVTDDQLYDFYHGEVRDYDEEMIQNKNAPDSIICRAGRDICAISASGDVYPCIAMPLVMGNLCDHSFRDIWYGEPLEKLRNYKFADVHQCMTCPDLDYCVRCWGLALIESHDLLGPSNLNCRVARIRHRVSIERGEYRAEEVRENEENLSTT